MFCSFKCHNVAQKRACVNYSNHKDSASDFGYIQSSVMEFACLCFELMFFISLGIGNIIKFY